MKKKLAMLLALVMGTVPLLAEGNSDPTVSSLWTALGIDFGTQMTNVFTALAQPVGVVVTVVFVFAVFWFCIKMARSAINKRQGL